MRRIIKGALAQRLLLAFDGPDTIEVIARRARLTPRAVNQFWQRAKADGRLPEVRPQFERDTAPPPLSAAVATAVDSQTIDDDGVTVLDKNDPGIPSERGMRFCDDGDPLRAALRKHHRPIDRATSSAALMREDKSKVGLDVAEFRNAIMRWRRVRAIKPRATRWARFKWWRQFVPDSAAGACIRGR